MHNIKFTLTIKFACAVLLLFFLPMITINILSYRNIENSITDEMTQTFDYFTRQYSDAVAYKLDLNANMLDNLAYNPIIQELLTRVGGEELSPVEINAILSFAVDPVLLLQSDTQVYDLRIYPLKKKLQTDGCYIHNIEEVQDTSWYNEAKTNSLPINISISYAEGIKIPLVMITKPIYELRGESFGARIGLIQVLLNADNLFKLEDNSDIMTFEISRENSNQKIIKVQSTPNTEEGIHITRGLLNYDLVLSFQFSTKQINDKINEALASLLLLVLFIILCIGVIIFFFIKLFSARIQKIIDNMKQVAQGSLYILPPKTTHDELFILEKNFYEMTVRLNNLIEDNYTIKLQKKEAELMALHAQINPHFLYNTLETINAIACSNNCNEICKVTQTLGDMLRYSINQFHGDFVFLKDELIHVKNYLEIQKIRFDGLFDYIIDVPDKLLNTQVIKIMLQPLVENALVHGIQKAQHKGLIAITAHVSNPYIVIEIQDDGVGIPTDVCEVLVSYINDNNEKQLHERTHIGIRNVHQRIRLAFSGMGGVVIQSVKGQGTIVRINIPQ